MPGYAASGWFGLGAPKGTSNEIIDKLNSEINAGVADPKMKAQLSTWAAADAEIARRVRQVHCRRNREVGQGGPKCADIKAD